MFISISCMFVKSQPQHGYVYVIKTHYLISFIYRVAKSNISKHIDDTLKPEAKDDVYPLKYYRWVVYTAEEAVLAHRQTHDPSMYNVPDALVYAQIEFNMQAVKQVGMIDC